MVGVPIVVFPSWCSQVEAPKDVDPQWWLALERVGTWKVPAVLAAVQLWKMWSVLADDQSWPVMAMMMVGDGW